MSHGGSLQMWREYFGDGARVVGIDSDPRCKALEGGNGIEVLIGNQEDLEFLRSLQFKMPRINIIVDDGGHSMQQMTTTFRYLYPTLHINGVCLVEDTHTCYQDEYGGGLGQRSSFIEYTKSLIDQLHCQYIPSVDGILATSFSQSTKSISFYDSIVVFEKGNVGQAYPSTFGRE